MSVLATAIYSSIIEFLGQEFIFTFTVFTVVFVHCILVLKDGHMEIDQTKKKQLKKLLLWGENLCQTKTQTAGNDKSLSETDSMIIYSKIIYKINK